ncbi:MAG: FAD-dependent oxidoreductase [Pirellulaceae bacterium]|nr:FAD-dependent oxidoreductase [Pirellulaceae bacterium]MDP7017925.1 FAD-dependent oxidoreductase [Pirellulaceae bacterium]
MERFSVEVPDGGYWRRQINCQAACPVHTDARGYVRAIADGRMEDAYMIARGPNPLASICGRVCGAPCEAACRRKEVDQAVSIRALKRFATDRYAADSNGSPSPRTLIERLIDHARSGRSARNEELSAFQRFLSAEDLSQNTTGEKIAIIGSGPAGLAAAHDLALLGFRPTVFEMERVPAGMLAVGIPEYRLPRDLIAAEVEFIKALGVEFRCNTKVGEDISMAEIRKEHLATIIAVGLKRSRALPIPGAEGDGVLGGVELLRDVALGNEIDLRGDVVVIGGGNVAYDIARTVVRQTSVDISRTALRVSGVHNVHLVSLEQLAELPADDAEIIEGDEEGVIRHHGLGPVEILLNDAGGVRGVAFQRCLRVFDENGRFAPLFDETDITVIDAETVLWGIGQQPDLTFVDEQDDVDRDQRGLIPCDEDTLRTSAADVFLAGDIAYGPRLLIDAVASGKKVARTVYEFIRGERLIEQEQLVHIDLPDYEREVDYEKLHRNSIPSLSAEQRKGSQLAIVEVGYDESTAICEGSRCLDCGVNTIFDSDKCILCGGCADVCPEVCLQLVSLDRLDGGASLSTAIDERLGAATGSAIIKDETRCIRCALCAERCPVNAISMERVSISSCWSVAGGETA